MHSKRTTLRILCFSILCSPVMAQVPYTFQDGEPALASQVNANFSELVQQIQDLQEQIDSMSSASSSSIVGTWDVVDLEASAFSASGAGFDVRNGGSRNTVVFNSDGTFTLSGTGYNNELVVVNDISPACTADSESGVGCEEKSAITVYVQGEGPEAFQNSGTYSLSGSALTINYDEGVLNAAVSEDRNSFIALQVEGGEITLTIGLKH